MSLITGDKKPSCSVSFSNILLLSISKSLMQCLTCRRSGVGLSRAEKKEPKSLPPILPPCPPMRPVATEQFTVLVPPPTHPDSLRFDRDAPDRLPIPLACQIDWKAKAAQKFKSKSQRSAGIAVVVHGLMDNRHKPLVSFLRDECLPYDTVTCDFRGCGESGGETSFSDHGKNADDLAAVVGHVEQTYGPVKAVLGHSAGGATVMIWAARYPEQSAKVGRIVTINALFYNGVPPPDEHRPADPLGLSPEQTGPLPKFWNKFRRGPKGQRNIVSEIYLEEAHVVYRNTFLPMDNHAPKIPPNVSVLVIMGEKDNLMVTARDGPLWKKHLSANGKRDLTVTVLPGCEHLYTDPNQQQLCGKTIVQWLSQRWPVDQDVDRLEEAAAALEADGAASRL